MIGLDRAQIFVGHVRRFTPSSSWRERNGDAILHIDRQRMIVPAHAQDMSFEVRQISTNTLRSAISWSRPMGSFSFITSTPWPMRSAWPRSTEARM